MKKDWVRSMTYEAIVILGVLALLTFICRLWPLLLLIMLGFIAAAIRLLFLRVKASSTEEPKSEPAPEPKPATERDVKDLAYSVILTRISELVAADYPQAKWVWEKPNARALVLNGEDACIILSGAGGYRRARAVVENLQLKNLEYLTAKETPPTIYEEVTETDEDEEENVDEAIPVNYDLMAFEWVEANLIGLNERCNDAIGEGKEELLIPEEELPVKESWESICKELRRADIENLEMVPEGIKIKFMH